MEFAVGAVAVGVGAALLQGLLDAIELDSASRKISPQIGLAEQESARVGGVARTPTVRASRT